MQSRQIVIGGFYKHFKNKLYQVKCVATHSETKEKMVVYQALYGDYGVYVRPYDMFMSEVDHDKYPEVKQKYRFEEVDITAVNNEKANDNQSIDKAYTKINNEADTDMTAQEEVQEIQGVQGIKDNVQELEAQDEDSFLVRFLDASEYKDKLDILALNRARLTEEIVDIMAESMDTCVPEGDIESKYNSLRKFIMAHVKYETNRLR